LILRQVIAQAKEELMREKPWTTLDAPVPTVASGTSAKYCDLGQTIDVGVPIKPGSVLLHESPAPA
jgi:hypothetical protein